MVEYIKKIELQSQFSIIETEEEREHLTGLKNEYAIDRYMRNLFNKYL